MTRIEEQPSFDPWLKKKSEQEKLKEEIRTEILKEMKKKKRRKFLTCCFLELTTILVLLSLVLIVLAKTGLVQIPFFSKFFFKKSIPQRIVTVTQDEIANFEANFTEKLKQQVMLKVQPGITGQKVEVNLELTENDLTAFIKNLEMNNKLPLKNSQASVTPEAIEIFGEIIEPQETSLIIAIKPELQDNNLKINFKKIKLGNLSIPIYFGSSLMNKFLTQQLREIEEAISRVGKLENISLTNKKIILKGQVDVLVFTQNQ